MTRGSPRRPADQAGGSGQTATGHLSGWDSPERRTHDYARHGTTTLFAALEVATGKVTDQCYPRHRHTEFLAFLKLVAKAYPRRQLHLQSFAEWSDSHAAGEVLVPQGIHHGMTVTSIGEAL